MTVTEESPPPTISQMEVVAQSNGADPEDITLDAILTHIGQFGRFQLFIFLLICLPMMFHAMFSVTYVFTAGTVMHR